MKISLPHPRFVLLGLLSVASSLSQAESPVAVAKNSYETLLVAPGASNASTQSIDAVVEAVRQTQLSAQVAGAVIGVNVKAGDRVKVGQVLISLDARNATDTATANQALVEAAKSSWLLASRDWERQKQLFEKQYISQAALERAQTQKEAAQARLQAAEAQARVANHQESFYQITAPYSGIVSELNTALGDMALPGKPLLTVYDPQALRLRAFVPQSLRSQLAANVKLGFELTETGTSQTTSLYEWLSVTDPATHTVELRIPLQNLGVGIQPGQFARIWLPVKAAEDQGAQRIWIPVSATVKRAEMTGVYVQKANGEFGLRQVRLGETHNNLVEVLSGLNPNEHVARDAHVVAAKAQ